MANTKEIQKLHKWLTVCWIVIISPVLLFFIPGGDIGLDFRDGGPEVAAPFLFWLLATLFYHVILGKLAARKNRSVINWVGGHIILSPLSFLIFYPLMLRAEVLPRKDKKVRTSA